MNVAPFPSACDLNCTTVLFNNIMHDRQPQSGAFGFGGEVRGEDGFKLIRRNSLTAVGNADFHACAAFAGRHANHAMLTNRLNSIEIEIQQDLSQPVRIGLNFR